MPRSPNTSDWLMLAALTLLWGTSFMFTALALNAFSPLELVAARLVIAAAVLSVYLKVVGERLPRTLSGWIPIAIMSVLGTVLPFNLLAFAQLSLESAVTGILTAIVPLFVLTLAHFLVPGARLTVGKLGGFVLGFTGVALVIGPDAIGGVGSRDAVVAMLAVLVAAVSYSVNTIYARLKGLDKPAVLSAGMLLLASGMMSPALVPEQGLPALPPPVALASLAVLGLLSTGLATVVYFRLIQGPGPTFLSLINYLVPACAVLTGAVVLGETLSAWTIAGLCLILAGVAISEVGLGGLFSLAGRAVKKAAAA
ncbi:MAG: DMT family transporter [Pseudomonadota bacterium]